MHNKLKSVLFRRVLLVGILILVQFSLMLTLVLFGSALSQWVYAILNLVSLLVAIGVIARNTKGSFKLSWVFLILTFPIFGGLLYLFVTLQSSTRFARERAARVSKRLQPLFTRGETALDRAQHTLPEREGELYYLEKTAGFPVYDQSDVEYLAPGEMFLPTLLEELEKAQKYIFIETFILEEGKMWGKIEEILLRKVRQGVQVRLLYDDFGCLLTLPKNFAENLRKKGLEVAVFNPVRPFMSVIQNNRDHRKITVIDGKVAFTGGINLADEYINEIERFGYWQDSGVCVRGKAAWSLTCIFLQNWELCVPSTGDPARFYPYTGTPCEVASDGFVQPYADSPLDHEHVSEYVYMQIINNAKKYLYITTPYLVIDESMVAALIMAAKSGVDVRLITPHIWDKKLVHITTRSYYKTLMDGGVKIYEFTPGFIHAKTFVCDDKVATVGTVNLDFRSLYLHFECGVKLYGGNIIDDMRWHFFRTLEQSKEITPKDIKSGIFRKLVRDILRLFAPLM